MIHSKRSTARCLPTVEPLEPRLFRDGTPWNWNAVMIHQDQAAADFPWLTGAGESVVVMDTGADISHPGLVGNRVIAWQDFVGASATAIDADGHGTGVAGIVGGNAFTYNGTLGQGIAPGVNLIILRTDDGKSRTTWGTTAARISSALDWVIAHQQQYNIVAVNMSTGGNTTFTSASLANDPYAAIDGELQQKFATLAASGVFLGAAAGNDGPTAPDSVEYPAADANVFAASSVNSTGGPSAYASRGSLVDLLAPGENIVMPYYFPKNAALLNTYYVNYGNGTSFSSPQMVGAAVLLKQIDPGFTPQQIMNILQASGTPVADAQTGHTFSLLNLDAAIKLALAEVGDSNNHSAASATSIPLAGDGHGQLDNLTLIGGQTNYYSFTLTRTSDVTLAINYGGTDVAAAELLTAGSSLIASIGGGLSQRLAAGKYLIQLDSATTLDEAFGISVDAVAVAPPIVNTATPATGATAAKIAYDSTGTLHMAFYDGVSNRLKYTTRSTSGVWSSVQTIDATPYAGSMLSIAIDPSGHAGIAYYEGNNCDLKYAHFNGSAWSVATVDSYRTVGQYPSLAYNSAGTAVIAYYYKTTGDLKFAVQRGTTWTIYTVDAAGDVGRAVDMAYDQATGIFGMAYDDDTNGAFKYASYLNRRFKGTIVGTVGKAGGAVISLQFDSAHQPAMSYFDAQHGNLILARSNGLAWSNQLVAGSPPQGVSSALSFDGSGNADILYFNQTTSNIFRASPSGSSWNLSPLTSGGLGLDAAGDNLGDESILWITTSGAQVMDV